MLKDGLVVIDVQYGLSAAYHYKQLFGCKLIPETTFKRGYNE